MRKKIQAAYVRSNAAQGRTAWTASEYAQALVSDSSDLLKLTMAKNGFRHPVPDLDQKVKHELSDYLWALMITATELGIDLEAAFLHGMNDLERKIIAISDNGIE